MQVAGGFKDLLPAGVAKAESSGGSEQKEQPAQKVKIKQVEKVAREKAGPATAGTGSRASKPKAQTDDQDALKQIAAQTIVQTVSDVKEPQPAQDLD